MTTLSLATLLGASELTLQESMKQKKEALVNQVRDAQKQLQQESEELERAQERRAELRRAGTFLFYVSMCI